MPLLKEQIFLQARWQPSERWDKKSKKDSPNNGEVKKDMRWPGMFVMHRFLSQTKVSMAREVPAMALSSCYIFIGASSCSGLEPSLLWLPDLQKGILRFVALISAFWISTKLEKQINFHISPGAIEIPPLLPPEGPQSQLGGLQLSSIWLWQLIELIVHNGREILNQLILF